jgi:hypothetical protein
MACNVVVGEFQKEDSKLEVSEKYIQLMQDSMNEESLYIRAKDTLAVLFNDLQIPEPAKAGMAADFVTKLATDLSKYSMSTALSWAKEERDAAYALAKIKADTEVSMANAIKAKEEVCFVEKQVEVECANIEATIAKSIRENGRVASYIDGGCKPETLMEEGLNYQRTKQIEADSYSRFADAYRKSGVVQIGVDASDNITKGLSGPIDPITGGYTNQQSLNAERQRVGYEDSKRNHVINASSSMLGQMLSAEIPIGDTNPDLINYRRAIDYLITDREDY